VTSALAVIGGERCVIDGEICVLNEQGFAGDAEFRRLFRRQVREDWEPGEDTVVLCAFDILVLNGRSIMHRPLLQRKWHLAKLLANVPHTLPVGEIVGDGLSLYKVALQLQLQGIVAKKLDAPY
jgi:bifunctional non-homologous end joining protein LigD